MTTILKFARPRAIKQREILCREIFDAVRAGRSAAAVVDDLLAKNPGLDADQINSAACAAHSVIAAIHARLLIAIGDDPGDLSGLDGGGS
jgi:hypothetical protein